MDISQANKIADAFLATDPNAKEELLRKRAKEDRWLVEKRKVAWLMLMGFAGGAAATYYVGGQFTSAGLWGAIAGGSVGWLWIGWRGYRRAAEQFRKR